jgi:hypothetical protein
MAATVGVEEGAYPVQELGVELARVHARERVVGHRQQPAQPLVDGPQARIDHARSVAVGRLGRLLTSGSGYCTFR